MKTLIKKKKSDRPKSLSHGLYAGRVKGEATDARTKNTSLEIEFPAADQSLNYELPPEFDEESRSGHELIALNGGPLGDEVTPDTFKAKEAFFVVVIRKTAGGIPKPEIDTILSKVAVEDLVLQQKSADEAERH